MKKRINTSLLLFIAMNTGLLGQGIIIQPGAYMTVKSNAYVKTLETAGLTVKSTSAGTGSVIDKASGISISGTTKVERYIANDLHWHFLSSPVSDQPVWPQFAPTPTGTVLTFGPKPYSWDFYYWNPNSSTAADLYWVNLRQDESGTYNARDIDASGSVAGFGAATPKFTVGRGYLVAYNNTWSATHEFNGGSLNGANVEKTILSGINTYNLVGNPFPSAINWDLADGETSWGRSGALKNTSGYDYWLWPDDGTGNYLYRNSGGTGTASNFIASGQGFFVQSDADGGMLYFRQDIKTHASQSWVKTATARNNLIRLKLITSANAYFDEMFVEFNPECSGHEGTGKFWSMYAEAPELFSVKEAQNYSIDRYRTFSNDLVVNISAKCGVAGNYTITATNIAGFDLSQIVILEDLKTGNKVNLKEINTYSFYGSPGDNLNRFVLTFRYGTGVDGSTAGKQVNVYAAGKDIILSANVPGIGNCQVMIFDALGRKVFSGNHDANAGKQVVATLQTPGTYVVKVISETGATNVKVMVK